MWRIIQDFLDRLEQAATSQQLCDAMATVAAGFDLQLFAYLAIPVVAGRQLRLISNYDERWAMHYRSMRYESCDPVILHTMRDPEPFEWGRDMAGGCPFAQAFFDEAGAFGICNGFTLPIRYWHGRVAALSFAADYRNPAFWNCLNRHELGFQVIARAFHLRVRDLRGPSYPLTGIHLTLRECQCLKLSACGKSFADIGLMLRISPRTVKFHIENAKAKFGVRTIREAVLRLEAGKDMARRVAYPVPKDRVE